MHTFILDRFWVDFGVENASKMEPEKVSKNIKEKSLAKEAKEALGLDFCSLEEASLRRSAAKAERSGVLVICTFSSKM